MNTTGSPFPRKARFGDIRYGKLVTEDEVVLSVTNDTSVGAVVVPPPGSPVSGHWRTTHPVCDSDGAPYELHDGDPKEWWIRFVVARYFGFGRVAGSAGFGIDRIVGHHRALFDACETLGQLFHACRRIEDGCRAEVVGRTLSLWTEAAEAFPSRIGDLGHLRDEARNFGDFVRKSLASLVDEREDLPRHMEAWDFALWPVRDTLEAQAVAEDELDERIDALVTEVCRSFRVHPLDPVDRGIRRMQREDREDR